MNEAAVKIALADKRFLLKRNELMAIAERVATEVENKLSRYVCIYLLVEVK